IEKGFAESALAVEDTNPIPAVHQTYLNPHPVLPKVKPTAKITVWPTTQPIFAIPSAAPSSLGGPQNPANWSGLTIGGGFGAKFGTLVHTYAVLLAMRTNRPVKIVYSREEEFLDGRPAPGAVIWVKTGVKKDGTIMARQAYGLWDSGCVPGASIHA